MLRIKRDIRGFTIVEGLVASAISVAAFGMSISTYFVIWEFTGEAAEQTDLQNRARLATDVIARNIRLASDIDCQASGDSIVMTFDPLKLGKPAGPETSSRYSLSEGTIRYRPDTNFLEEVPVIDDVAPYPGSKLFSYDSSSQLVTIDLRVEKSSGPRDRYARLITIVKVRNAE